MQENQIKLTTPDRLKRIVPVTLWLLLAIVGLWYMADYSNTPGVAAANTVISSQFPGESRLGRIQGRPTLIMLVHPHCPCSRASMGELELLMAQTQVPVTTFVLFLKPSGFTDDWEKTDLWTTASGIPGVKVVKDVDGKEATLFNAETSGQTFLYDADGKLIFKGGITDSRGHSGDNAGRSTILSLLNEGKADQTETNVYGCPLFNKDSECPMPK